MFLITIKSIDIFDLTFSIHIEYRIKISSFLACQIIVFEHLFESNNINWLYTVNITITFDIKDD